MEEGWGRVKCHGPLICFQLSYGTLLERVRHVHAGFGGVKSLSLAVTDGFCSLFSLSFPWRLGHISSVISNRVLCLYELIKGGRKQREDTSNSCVHLSLLTVCNNLLLTQASRRFNWHAYARRGTNSLPLQCLIDYFQLMDG